MIFVIGSRGRLGQAISSLYPQRDTAALKRDIYQDWWKQGSAAEIARFFEPHAGSDTTIFITAGLLDPKLPADDHIKVNYLLPKNVIAGTSQLGVRVVTFGTIMEKVINHKNSYIESKAALGEYVEARGAGRRALHVRVHTLFGGGEPSRFMFLGQIHQALLNRTAFDMSPGNQLREYHHLDDEARAIRALAESGITGAVDLSHGQPVSLKDLALHVFAAFDAGHLLRVGALPAPPEENYGTTFSRLPLLQHIDFRNTLPAVVSYLQELSPQKPRMGCMA